MYTNAQDYEKIAKRISGLHQEHERELDEVALYLFFTLSLLAFRCCELLI